MGYMVVRLGCELRRSPRRRCWCRWRCPAWRKSAKKRSRKRA